MRNVNIIKKTLGETVCNRILFCHAILGCDTTSRFFGIGKGLALKKIMSDFDFIAAADVFYEENPSTELLIAAGEKAIALLYGGKHYDILDELRYQLFEVKVKTSSKTAIHPKQLPPTSAAAKYHSLRTFFQVRTWMGEYYSDVLCPEQYGWEKRNDILQPIMTHLDPASEYLLSITKCGCKGTCNSRRCSCRKNGIECSVSCTNCKGTNCTNCSLQNTNI